MVVALSPIDKVRVLTSSRCAAPRCDVKDGYLRSNATWRKGPIAVSHQGAAGTPAWELPGVWEAKGRELWLCPRWCPSPIFDKRDGISRPARGGSCLPSCSRSFAFNFGKARFIDSSIAAVLAVEISSTFCTISADRLSSVPCPSPQFDPVSLVPVPAHLGNDPPRTRPTALLSPPYPSISSPRCGFPQSRFGRRSRGGKFPPHTESPPSL